MPSIFHTSTPLEASAETMFGFHSDPANLTVVMPPTLRLVSLTTDGLALGRVATVAGASCARPSAGRLAPRIPNHRQVRPPRVK